MAVVLQDKASGGEGGIRTPDTRKGMSDFESGAFNRALPPLRTLILQQVNYLRVELYSIENAPWPKTCQL